MSEITAADHAKWAFHSAQQFFMEEEIEATLTQTLAFAAMIVHAGAGVMVSDSIDQLTAEIGGEDGALDAISSRISGVAEMIDKHG